MTKKLMSVLLAVAMCLSLAAPAVAVERETEEKSTYMAQIYHATGVDKYGSNIKEVSETFPNVPVSVSQSINGLVINFQVADFPIEIYASARGKNSIGNMMYYDTTDINSDTVETMMLAYIENFSKAGVLSQKYCEEHPNTSNVLEYT